jgi:hypothetical protein
MIQKSPLVYYALAIAVTVTVLKLWITGDSFTRLVIDSFNWTEIFSRIYQIVPGALKM